MSLPLVKRVRHTEDRSRERKREGWLRPVIWDSATINNLLTPEYSQLTPSDPATRSQILLKTNS